MKLGLIPVLWLLAWVLAWAVATEPDRGSSLVDSTVGPAGGFAYLDRNRDGRLSRLEINGIEDLDFGVSDRNRDGLLSSEEYHAAVVVQ